VEPDPEIPGRSRRSGTPSIPVLCRLRLPRLRYGHAATSQPPDSQTQWAHAVLPSLHFMQKSGRTPVQSLRELQGWAVLHDSKRHPPFTHVNVQEPGDGQGGHCVQSAAVVQACSALEVEGSALPHASISMAMEITSGRRIWRIASSVHRFTS
jgi:hypothetical protein